MEATGTAPAEDRPGPIQLVAVPSKGALDDVHAFDAFYRAQWTRLLAVCRPLVGSSAVAEELVQEALFSAHRRWEKVSTLDRPDLWVRHVVVNMATSHWRRRAIEARVNRLHHATDPVEAVDPPAADDALWTSVSRLPERQRTAVVLHYVDRLTTGEIARVLGCSSSTVQSHLARGREALRRDLGVFRTTDGGGRE